MKGWVLAAGLLLLATEDASAKGLTPLFQTLAAVEAHHAQAPVVVMQVGDSHSAGDFLSARLRDLFQARFGAAGRGMLPPGIADKYYDPKLVHVQASDDWKRSSSRDPRAAGPFGIAGIVQTADAAPQRMSLEAEEPEGFDRGFVEVLRHPDGGRLLLQVDETPLPLVSTRGPDNTPLWIDTPARPGARRLTLATSGGRVDVLAWGAARRGAGVLWENFGIIGASIDSLGRDDPRILRAEFSHHRPTLIVVAFGSNDAVSPNILIEQYRALFAQRVGVLADAAPGAGILILGPPDIQQDGATAVDGTPCGARPGEAAWVRPRRLDAVIADQRAAAQARGWAFWDWSAAMGGACAMHRWASQDPPLGRRDHVHLQPAGYARTAEMLFASLMDQYAAYRLANRVSASRRPRE